MWCEVSKGLAWKCENVGVMEWVVWGLGSGNALLWFLRIERSCERLRWEL